MQILYLIRVHRKTDKNLIFDRVKIEAESTKG